MQARVRRSEGARTHAHEHGSTQHVPRSTQRARCMWRGCWCGGPVVPRGHSRVALCAATASAARHPATRPASSPLCRASFSFCRSSASVARSCPAKLPRSSSALSSIVLSCEWLERSMLTGEVVIGGACSAVALFGFKKTRLFSAVSRRDLSSKLTRVAHGRKAGVRPKVKTPSSHTSWSHLTWKWC